VKKKDKELDPWKKGLQLAMTNVKKVTSWGREKSGKVSQLAKHQVKKGLLGRELNTLFQELGELTSQLLKEKIFEHESLKRTFERIQGVNRSIQEENEIIDQIKQGKPPSDES